MCALTLLSSHPPALLDLTAAELQATMPRGSEVGAGTACSELQQIGQACTLSCLEIQQSSATFQHAIIPLLEARLKAKCTGPSLASTR